MKDGSGSVLTAARSSTYEFHLPSSAPLPRLAGEEASGTRREGEVTMSYEDGEIEGESEDDQDWEWDDEEEDSL
jgi:hypothetical protein